MLVHTVRDRQPVFHRGDSTQLGIWLDPAEDPFEFSDGVPFYIRISIQPKDVRWKERGRYIKEHP